MKRFSRIAAITAAAIIPLSVPVMGNFTNVISSAASAENIGVHTNYHTQEEITEYYKEHPFNVTASAQYTVNPSMQSPYSAGKLSETTLNDALNALNVVRYIAGLDEVSLNSQYNELTQAASLVNAVNNSLSHSPSQPDQFPDDLYNDGRTGAGSSNISYGYANPANSIIYGYMNDSDSYNISRLGHRRWCLNPSMEQTGFGMVGRYSAMYAFDNSFGNTDKYGVAWPARNTPAEFLSGNCAWSYSYGKNVDANRISVTLTDNKNGKVYKFGNSSSDGYFNVDNDGYGKPGCIIFQPPIDDYSAGDSYTVKIDGLDESVQYSVDFFDVNDITLTPGDANGDGFVNAMDVTVVLKHTVELVNLTGNAFKNADVNTDGFVDSRDATLILKMIANMT